MGEEDRVPAFLARGRFTTVFLTVVKEPAPKRGSPRVNEEEFLKHKPLSQMKKNSRMLTYAFSLF